jgi:hypothetical protein
MSTYERSIVSILEPSFKLGATSQGKLVLDEVFITDTESKEAKDTYQGNLRPLDSKASSRAGSAMPVIAINSLILGEDEVEDFEIDLSDSIPKLLMNFVDKSNHFSIGAPIDGDVISIYLRPGDADNQKPIRIDFNIQRILGDPVNHTYFIVGSMKLHRFFSETFKSFPENTSFEHLQDVCEDIGLGFASNETSTDDTMKRLIPAETYETFVNETVSSTYKDEDSFFDWYIDPYYYLCLVNVNKQFSLEDKTEDVNISDAFPTSGVVGVDKDRNDKDAIKGSLVLTNLNNMSGKNVFIEAYNFENNSGSVWLNNGYLRYAQWLNIEEESIEYQKAFVDPFTTPGAEENFRLLKGRKADGPPNFPKPLYLKESRYKWMGKQGGNSFGGNVHDNYCYAQVLNHQNLEELRKTRLVVDLAGMNHYLYKYQRIPVMIYESSVNQNAANMQTRDIALGESEGTKDPNTQTGMFAGAGNSTSENKSKPDPTNKPQPEIQDQIKNEFLSGYYVIADMKFTYVTGSGVKQRLTLIRREWPIPAKHSQQG